MGCSLMLSLAGIIEDNGSMNREFLAVGERGKDGELIEAGAPMKQRGEESLRITLRMELCLKAATPNHIKLMTCVMLLIQQFLVPLYNCLLLTNGALLSCKVISQSRRY